MSSPINISAQKALASAKRIVIKVGSALLMEDEKGHLSHDWMRAMAADIAEAQKNGQEIILVSSGAIALGRGELGLTQDTLTRLNKAKRRRQLDRLRWPMHGAMCWPNKIVVGRKFY